MRRIIGRVMALTTGTTDVEMLCGTDQLASGLKAGIEGAVHAMTVLYTQYSGNGWGLLLVDAKNAFNMSCCLVECSRVMASMQPFFVQHISRIC